MKYIKNILSICLFLSCFGCTKSMEKNPDALKIVHLDCGRKYFGPNNIKKLIDLASQGNITHIELAIGNDGLRFLLDDMSIQNYDSKTVKEGIHKGNEEYANFEVDELCESDMDEIIAYANEKNIGIIPLINSPGHMDSILSCITYCGIKDASYHHSKRTIDLKNEEAVAFSQAILQKYIDYFSEKGCSYFSIGADEYANDVYSKGKMGFGKLIQNQEYGYFVDYVNTCAKLVKEAGMVPMVFNDGIYFDRCFEYGEFDTDLLICYWSNGDILYRPCSAKNLQKLGFHLINTNSNYYWVLENKKWQCSESKVKKLNDHNFKGGKLSSSTGNMFCIWCDDPQADTDSRVIERVSNVVLAYGSSN